MYEFKVCRICLSIGVQMFELQGLFGDCLNELLGHEILYSAGFPPYVCYECAYLLQKFVKFKEKCLLGQNVLLEILKHNNQITKENILIVDRINLKLVSNLNISPVPAESVHNFQDTADSDDEQDKDKHIIKDEVGISDDSAGILDENDDNESVPGGEEKQDEQNTLNENDNHSQMQYDDFDDDYDVFVKASEDCVICRKKKDTSELVNVWEQGINTLKKFSLLRNDGLFPLFNSVKVIELHLTCRKKYIRLRNDGKYVPLKATDFLPKIKEPKTKKQDKPKKPKKKILRAFDLPSLQDQKIDYKTNCCICLKDVTLQVKKRIDRRDRICTVSRTKSKETIMRNLLGIKNSSPSYSNINETIERIKDLDLINIGAVYHRKCYHQLRIKNYASCVKAGRPVNKQIAEAMNLIYSYMEEMCDGSEFTFEELSDILPGYVPDRKTILRKLKDHFQDRIDVTKGMILLKY